MSNERIKWTDQCLSFPWWIRPLQVVQALQKAFRIKTYQRDPRASPVAQRKNPLGILSPGKESACQCRRPGFELLVQKMPWQRKWQPTPIFLAWKIPRTEVPGRLQSMGFQRVGHDWVTNIFTFRGDPKSSKFVPIPSYPPPLFHLGKGWGNISRNFGMTTFHTGSKTALSRYPPSHDSGRCPSP